MANFTPGPWRVLPIEPGYFPSVDMGGGLPYADNSGIGEHELCVNEGQPPNSTTWGNTMEACIANAHLIAAAPELYEALRRCLPMIVGEVPAIAIAALAKAEAH